MRSNSNIEFCSGTKNCKCHECKQVTKKATSMINKNIMKINKPEY